MPVPKQKQGRIRTHTRRSANMKISLRLSPRAPVAALSSSRITCAPAAVSTRTARLSLPSNCILWMRCRSNWNHNAGSMSRPFLYKEYMK